jgi:hypothetical protein
MVKSLLISSLLVSPNDVTDGDTYMLALEAL